MSQVFVTRTIYSNVYLHIPYTFYIIDDNNLYSLYLHIPYVLLIIIIIHLLKNTCVDLNEAKKEIWHREEDLHIDNLKSQLHNCNIICIERDSTELHKFFWAACVSDWVENTCIAFNCKNNSVRDCQYTTLLDMCPCETAF